MDDLVPFQVQLERRQHARLKALAEARGQSMGSMIRESVAVYLTSQEAGEDPLLGIIGLFEDAGPQPHGDVATNHDAYLADASWEEGHPEPGQP
ncbi:MAG: ribbon-helix-helix protein, CopG family [Chloroflexota bacterium]